MSCFFSLAVVFSAWLFLQLVGQASPNCGFPTPFFSPLFLPWSFKPSPGISLSVGFSFYSSPPLGPTWPLSVLFLFSLCLHFFIMICAILLSSSLLLSCYFQLVSDTTLPTLFPSILLHEHLLIWFEFQLNLFRWRLLLFFRYPTYRRVVTFRLFTDFLSSPSPFWRKI